MTTPVGPKSPPVAMVTGAGRGIGQAIARAFWEAGYEVWGVVRQASAFGEFAGERTRLKTFVADLAQREQVLALCKDIAALGRTPDVLVNNAGAAVSAPLPKHSVETFDMLLAVNTIAPFLICQEIVPKMAERGSGRVLNIASTAGLRGFRYTAGYAASKHALVGLTRSWALEYAHKGVTLNAVCPGWTDTDMVQRSTENIARTTGRSEEEARKALVARNPMGRFVKPEEVAQVCLFLASENASAITGATYVIDGGESV